MPNALLAAAESAALNTISVTTFALLFLPFARRRHFPAIGALCAFIVADSLILAVPPLMHWRVGHWNWIGKLASIAFSLAVTRFCLSPEEVAWRLPRGRPAIVWTLAGILVAAVLAIPAELLDPSGKVYAETFLFEATLPGLDEELAFRGIGIALLLKAFSTGPADTRAPLLSAVVSSLWFATAHVVNIDHGRLGVAWLRVLDTLPFGLWFALVRLRSGSLFGGILAYNTANTIQETLSAFGI